MAESQKEDASTAKVKNKPSSSDDFGKEFLSSWKSMSVSEDDGLDFSKEAVPKGKKSAFNFDKLDMDFSLDGDFGKKMSSFNVDMSDLDFDRPLKKPLKPKDKSTEESLGEKQRGKQSRFTFDFDFNELDSFDFGSSPLKGKKKSDNASDLKGFDSPGKQEKVQMAKSRPVESIELPEDNFDFSTSFLKGGNKSEKAADLKEFDSPRKQENVQTARSKPVASFDLPEDCDTDKLHTSQQASTSKFEPLIGSTEKSHAINDSPSTSASSENFSPPHTTVASPAKEIYQCSQQSEKTVSTEPITQNTIQDSPIRSLSVEGSVQEAFPDTHGEVCSSDTEQKTNPEESLDISVKLCNLEVSPTTHAPGRTSAKDECDMMLRNESHIGDTPRDESMQGDIDINDSAVGNIAQKMLQSTKPAKENNVKTKLLVALLPSEPKVHQLTKEKRSGSIQSKYFNKSVETESQLKTQSIPTKMCFADNKKAEKVILGPMDARSEPKTHQLVKEKGSGSIQSKYFSKSVETESQLNSQSISEKICSVINKRTENVHIIPADPGREECTFNDAQAGNRKVDSPKSHEPAVTKVIPIILRNGKNNENQEVSAGFHSTRLPEQTVKSTYPKSVNSKLVSSIATLRNSKSSFVEGNKLSSLRAAKNTVEASYLKVSRLVTLKDVSHSRAIPEINSLRHSEKSTEIRCASGKMEHTVSMEKQGLLSPPMKRKICEAPNADPVTLYPLKHATESPIECRGPQETSERADKKRVRSTENLVHGFHSSPIPDIPRDECWKELEVSLMMESDDNVEKAEACAKELDDICNMLRKKHEESKELLVRSIVNNNNLLMLSHPICQIEEKIRMVQQFANLMLSPQPQS